MDLSTYEPAASFAESLFPSRLPPIPRFTYEITRLCDRNSWLIYRDYPDTLITHALEITPKIVTELELPKMPPMRWGAARWVDRELRRAIIEYAAEQFDAHYLETTRGAPTLDEGRET